MGNLEKFLYFSVTKQGLGRKKMEQKQFMCLLLYERTLSTPLFLLHLYMLRPCLVPNFFGKINIVAFSFVFDKYYLIMD